MTAELENLRIDRTHKASAEPPSRALRWIAGGLAMAVLLAAAAFAYTKVNAATEVEIYRVKPASGMEAGGRTVVLNATGYIIAAHKIEVASKVVGKVAWIGVEKGNSVKAGQDLVRLEDDEYRAQVLQAQGNLDSLKARLAEFEHGSRPEEIARAKADVDVARADLENYSVTLGRTLGLVKEGVFSKQAMDDAQAKYDGQAAKVASLQRTYELTKLGPRQEQIDGMRAQVQQAQGALAFARTQLDNTVIRAPVTGTILERNVEKGEFVTTGFVGDKGAKGYVVSLADLNDLEVELDINQNDFARLRPAQPGIVTTDAYPDRRYEAFISEISPEANRQKATVQVKVKVEKPDGYLRPDMNASVAFYDSSNVRKRTSEQTRAAVVVPPSAVRDGAVYVVSNGRAVRRKSSDLIGGEDIVVDPPAGLKEGQKVRSKQG